MRRTLLPLLALGALWPSAALANGRPVATVNVRFEPKDTSLMLVPSTFGLLISSDGGDSFQWVCEDTIGYGGTYDPDYAVTQNGDIYATTFEGLRVSHDGGCTFDTIGDPFTNKWVGEVEVAPDGTVWASTSTGGEPNDVYVSEDGQNFVSAGTENANAWWKSLRATSLPGGETRVYLTGFLPGQSLDDGGITPPEALLRRTDNGGAMWQDLPVTDFDFGSQPQLMLLGVSPTDPDVVFVRVLQANAPVGDALYRSDDAGASWTKVLDMAGSISAFTIRSDGQTVIVGTVEPCPGEASDADKGCVRISSDGGVSFDTPTEEPKMACVGERSDGTLFACGSNWAPDMFALGSSTDGQTWDTVMRLADIEGPLDCPSGTAQNECVSTKWPTTCQRIGVCEAADAGPSAAADGGTDGGGGGGGGCGCQSTGAPLAGLLLLLLVPLVLRRRRT